MESGDDKSKLGCGSIVIRDMNIEKDYEVAVIVDSGTSVSTSKDINSYVKSSAGEGLQRSIFNAFDAFFQEYHSK